MQTLITEYLRPWKLASLAVGLGMLLLGADYYNAPDWDYAISVVMATLTYLTAPWSVRVLKDRHWRRVPLALFWYYLAVDGSYWLYWRSVNPDALDMREANFYASSCLYWLCGFIWLHDGPLKKLLPRREDAPVSRAKRPSLRQMIAGIATTIAAFGVAYFIYSAATGRERMTEVCRRIAPGMNVSQLMAYAERHGLGPRRHIDSRTRLAYLAETRTMGRHACRIELEEGRVRSASYNYAD